MSSSASPPSEEGSTSCPGSPGKVTATFGEVTVSSNFDSGNLARVEECKNRDSDTYEFDLWTSRDCAGTEFENPNKSWFYFSVCTPPDFSDKVLKFNVKNLNKQAKLYQQGLTPIIKTVPGRGGWERLRNKVDFEIVEEGLSISFQYCISDSRRLTTYFAFCYPYSYTKCQQRLARLDEQFKFSDLPKTADSIYYKRELVCHSLEGRRIDLLTVTSWEGISEEREPRLLHLFPDTTAERCHIFKNKKVIFVSSRVHPGETPSSHVFNGLLQFLLRPNDPRAIAARRKFVFKLIPMLNPDGVFRGHYRTDTRGANLNRYYLDPDPMLHPSIYAARSLIMDYHQRLGTGSLASNTDHLSKSAVLCREAPKSHAETTSSLSTQGTDRDVPNQALPSNSEASLAAQSCKSFLTKSSVRTSQTTSTSLASHSRKALQRVENDHMCEHLKASTESGLALYIDLHAHATKRGVFMYGNYFTNVIEAAETMLFPKLMSLNSPHLDFEHCVFSEKNMYTSDKRDGMSKEGSGRVAMHKATGIIPCYTLECNYNSGRQCNLLSEATLDDGKSSPAQPFSPIAHRLSIADFEQVGRAIVYSVLDQNQINPWTRLPNTNFGSLVGVRQSLIQRINIQRAKKPSPSHEANDVAVEGLAEGLASTTVSDNAAQPNTPHVQLNKQRPLGISRRAGQISERIALAEAKQRKSAMLRASNHMHGNVITTSTKNGFKRTERVGKTFPMQSMKTSPASVIFPSPLTAQGRTSLNGSTDIKPPPPPKPVTTTTTNHAVTESRLTTNRRRLLRSRRAMAPVTPTYTTAGKFSSIPSSSKGREQTSVYIGSINHQQNGIPPLDYYTKGTVFGMPEQGSCRATADEALTGRKLGPLEPPDRVFPSSASH